MCRFPNGFLIVLGLLLPGCGQSDSVIVRGRLETADGQPVRFGGESYIRFHPADAKTQLVFGAALEADGSFTILGDEKNGVPSGRYLISISTAEITVPGSNTANRAAIVNARYRWPETPLSLDVARGGGEQLLKIDLAPPSK